MQKLSEFYLFGQMREEQSKLEPVELNLELM